MQTLHEVTANHVVQATIQFSDFLTKLDPSLQVLVTCPGVTPLLLWTETAIESFGGSLSSDHRPDHLKWGGKKLPETYYVGVEAMISISIIGKVSEKVQCALLGRNGFLHNVIGNTGWYEINSVDNVPRKIRFEISFNQAATITVSSKARLARGRR
ncbi:hypothetical protein JCM5353_002164 [Sporobolomyces roseus]